MNLHDDLVYSDDLGCAFLTAIVQAFASIHPDVRLGRTAMQKLTYFVKILGAPVPFRFGIYTYGPYSDHVTFSVESLLADEVIVDLSDNPNYSNYKPGQNAQELLSEFVFELNPYEHTVHQVVERLGRLLPGQLELVSTLHFIATRQMQIFGHAEEESVLSEFRAIKGDKFGEADVRSCYLSLYETGLLPKSRLRAIGAARS